MIVHMHAGLAALPALRELDCSGNSLTGPLPKDWDSARQLVLLYLQNNQLTGVILAVQSIP